jgi:hypothetical protein
LRGGNGHHGYFPAGSTVVEAVVPLLSKTSSLKVRTFGAVTVGAANDVVA